VNKEQDDCRSEKGFKKKESKKEENKEKRQESGNLKH